MVFYACIGFVLVAIGTLLAHKLAGPVAARNITSAPAGQVPAAPSVQPIHVQDMYAAFSYPDSLKPLPNPQTPAGDIVATYSYGKADVEPWHLAITINQLHEPVLTDDSGYVLRRNDPARYHVSNITAGGNTFTVMTDTQTGGFSEAAFTLRGNLSADISLTGDDPSDTVLPRVFRQVLQSWHWQT